MVSPVCVVDGRAKAVGETAARSDRAREQGAEAGQGSGATWQRAVGSHLFVWLTDVRVLYEAGPGEPRPAGAQGGVFVLKRETD